MTQMITDWEDNGKDPQTYAIIGAAIEVHRQLGHGFLEPVYQDALGLEFTERGIAFQPQVELAVHYKGKLLESTFKPDFVCFGAVIVELKALGELTTREYSQVLNYLKVTNFTRGLLINFGTSRLECKRFVHSSYQRSSALSVDQSLDPFADHRERSEEVSGG